MYEHSIHNFAMAMGSSKSTSVDYCRIIRVSSFYALERQYQDKNDWKYGNYFYGMHNIERTYCFIDVICWLASKLATHYMRIVYCEIIVDHISFMCI